MRISMWMSFLEGGWWKEKEMVEPSPREPELLELIIPGVSD